MFMRLVTVYSSSCLQAVLFYLHPFRRTSLLNYASQPKITKKLLESSILRVKNCSRSSILIPLKSSSPVLVTISSTSPHICNRFHAGQANSDKLTSFHGVPIFDTLVRGKPPHPAMQNFGTLSYAVNLKSLSTNSRLKCGRRAANAAIPPRRLRPLCEPISHPQKVPSKYAG